MKRIMIIAVCVFAMAGVCNAQTYVSGAVSGVWDSTGSPYYVTDTIRVLTDDTLIIMPGVDVIFLGHYKVAVDSAAVIKALGTETDTIRFLPSDTSYWSPGWHGLRFYYASDACSLSYCELAYGFAYGPTEDDSCGGAIWSYYSHPTFEHCLIRDNWANLLGGAIYTWNSVIVFSNCKIINNVADADGGGFYITHSSIGSINECVISENNPTGIFLRSDMTVSNNLITDNIGDGIHTNGGGVSEYDFYGNFIDSNTGYGIYAHGFGRIICNTISNNLYGGIYTYLADDIIGNEILNNAGSGIYSTGIHDTISDNLISGNTGGDGGGIHYEYSSPIILNNRIVGNFGSSGGGIYSWRNSDSVIKNNYIADNSVTGQGGGIHCSFDVSGTWDMTPEINGNTIKGNSASQGGGIYSSNEPKISNNMISHNTATHGAGIYMTGKPCISNNTIVYNNGDGCYFSGYYKGMLNTIVYGNTGYEIYADAPCSVGFAYCDIDTDDVFGSVILWGPANIDADPLFEDTLFHLSGSSLCVNSGAQMFYFPTITEEVWADTFDFEGDFRPVRVWDIGADEYDTSSYISEIIPKPSRLDISAHPNPFNSAITISVGEGLRPSRVEIFDINGRSVAEIPVGATPCGRPLEGQAHGPAPTNREYIWTPDESVGSGIYLVRVRIGDESVIKRVVLIK